MVVIALAGCVDQHTVTDTGRACVFATLPPAIVPTPQTFEVGEPLVLDIVLHSCLSACASNRHAMCHVTRTDNALDVTARGAWSDPARNRGCTDQCVSLAVVCRTEPLEAGTYAIDYAGETTTVTVPSMVAEQPCAGVEN